MSDDDFMEQVKPINAGAVEAGARIAFGYAAEWAAECETGTEAAELISRLAARARIWGDA